jgi:Putative DNA-binding domain
MLRKSWRGRRIELSEEIFCVKPETLERLLHESECTYLDFKQAQYAFSGANDEVKSELLKDVLAFANADNSNDRYILMGVEEVRGSRAKVIGVTSQLNDHDLQQFVASKTNRLVKLSYEVVPCDGLLVGVLQIPAQERYFFLKNDFGKLRKNILYYRLGSSIREANPDEIIRWRQQAAVKNSEPAFDLQFALIKRPTAIGGNQSTKEAGVNLSVRTRYTAPVPGVELAKPYPDSKQIGFVSEADYWMGFAKFLRSAMFFAPVGLALKNVGETTASDVRIELTPKSESKLLILGDAHYPIRPLHSSKLRTGGLYASHTRFKQEDILVSHESDNSKICWNIPKALPHLPIYSTGMFYVSTKESSSVEFNCWIFAENLRRRMQKTLKISIELESRDLTIEEIQSFSNEFTLDDNLTGTGRVA